MWIILLPLSRMTAVLTSLEPVVEKKKKRPPRWWGTGTMPPVYTDAIVGQTRGEEQGPGRVQVLPTPSLFTESGTRKLSTRRNPGSHLGMAQQVYRHWREPTVGPWRHHEEQTSSTDSGSVETSWRTNIFHRQWVRGDIMKNRHLPGFPFYILFTFTHLTLNSLCTLMCTAGTLWPNLHCKGENS